MKPALIGSGLIGRAWAITFARAGHDIRLWNADPAAADKALGCIGEVLPGLELKQPVERQLWLDRRPTAPLAHKRKAAREI